MKRIIFILLISLIMLPTAAWAIVVLSTADSGPGSLREAIGIAKGDGVPTLINFDPTVFPATIYITTSQLPALTDPGDMIDGSGNGVVLDGSVLTGSQVGLRVRASNITIRGLTIQDFPSDGIRIQSQASTLDTVMDVVITDNVIRRNLDGLRVDGQAGPGNRVSATINNNQFMQNRDDGIFVSGSFGSTGNGGNTVDVIIDSNFVKGSQGVVTGGTRTGDGIRVLGGRGNGSNNALVAIISNNNVRDNVDDGIVVAGAGGDGTASNNIIYTEIVDNNVENSGDLSSLNGIGIAIRGGNREGVTVEGSNNEVTFLIADNLSKNSKDRGINISGGLGASHYVSGTISENIVKGSGLSGIRLTGGSGTENILQNINIMDNKASYNGLNGIIITPGSGLENNVSVSQIADNMTKKNGQDGILIKLRVMGSGTTSILGNRADQNEQDGIDLNSTGYVVYDNTANHNEVDGINAIGNTDGGGNTAFGNASCNTPGCF